jgi:hypothetical protein
MDESEFNPARRRLCPDGACVGLVGDDGRCRVCGRSVSGGRTANGSLSELAAHGDGGAGLNGTAAAAADKPVTENTAERASADFRANLSDGDADGAGFRADRRLCEDGDCIGVLDAAGVCPICGRSAAG